MWRWNASFFVVIKTYLKTIIFRILFFPHFLDDFMIDSDFQVVGYQLVVEVG